MGNAASAAIETFQASIALGRRSLRPCAWLLAVTAVIDFTVRTILAAATGSGSVATDPAQGLVVLVASELMLLDVAIIAMVSLLLLPIQDAIERGQAIGATRATAILVKKTLPLTLSGIVQGAIITGPPILFLMASVAPVVAPIIEAGGATDPGTLSTMLAAAIWRAAWRSLAWILVTSLFLLFAWPYLIFENRGPIRSIGLSAALVVRRGLSDWSRFLAVFFLWAALAAVILLPQMVARLCAPSHLHSNHLHSVLSVAWTAVTSALALVWFDAGLVTLFRRLVPARP